MKKSGSVMATEGQNALGCNEKLGDRNNYEGKFNTLRIISLKAISEFEALQKKCEENYAKYSEERENYVRTKSELDILKEVSSEALAEYENLHRKYKIEQGCKDKAEEFAKQAVKENKQLKRQSTILISTLTTKIVDIDLGEIANEVEKLSTATTEDHGLCNKQIEGLKDQVESLKVRTDELSQKLEDTEESLRTEEEEHEKTKVELQNHHTNFKQLNQVSLLALDDYSNLQRKYEMEIQCRAQAEKIASEESNNNDCESNEGDNESTVSRDNEVILKQGEFISKDIAGEELLQKALDEISTLTKRLHDQKTEFDDKVKELEEEFSSSNDVHRLKSLEGKINAYASGMETLETRLSEAQKRVIEAEAKAKIFQEQLKLAQTRRDSGAYVPLPPPPPPPPPPAQLLKKFVNILGSGKKRSARKQKDQKPEDPRITAMTDMMERIKTGNIELRKTGVSAKCLPGGDEDDGSAMRDLKDVLKTLKRSPSKQNTRLVDSEADSSEKHTFGIQLRKTEDRKPRSLSNVEDAPLKGLTLLRKPRSHSTSDVLDDEEPEMDKDLQALLKKHKAAAERDVAATLQKEEQKEEQGEKKEQKEEENPSTF